MLTILEWPELGRYLKKVRVQQKKTMKEAVSSASVSVDTLCRLESGEEVSLSKIVLVAGSYGLHLQFVLSPKEK